MISGKNIFGFFTIILISLSQLVAQQPAIDWVISDSNIVNIAIDSDDKIICLRKKIKGYSITKYDNNGSQVWTIQDNFNINTLKDIKVDNDNNILIFGTERIYHHTDNIWIHGTTYVHKYYLTSFCIAKYDRNGNNIYRKKYESAISRGGIDIKAIEIDTENNIYLCANVRDTAKIDTAVIIHPLFKIYDIGGTKNPFIAKISTNGNIIWLKEFLWDVDITDLSVDQNNLYIIGSFYYGTINIDGLFKLINEGNSSVFIVKYAYNGIPVWAKNLGSKALDKPGSISSNMNNEVIFSFQMGDTIGKYGNYIISSNSEISNIYDYSEFLLRIDPIAGLEWYKSIVMEDDYSEMDLYCTSDYQILSFNFNEHFQYDNLVINSNGQYDICLLKTDNSGNLIWFKHIGSFDNEKIIRVFTDTNNNTYFLGSFESTVPLGGTVLTTIICKLSDDVLIPDNTMPFENRDDLFKIYPNPVNDIVYIDAPEPFIITIYDLFGKIIRRSEGESMNEQQVNIADLQSGIYLLKIESSHYYKTEKIIKK